jgi:hypothetical protein
MTLRGFIPTKLHGVISQKIIIFIWFLRIPLIKSLPDDGLYAAETCCKLLQIEKVYKFKDISKNFNNHFYCTRYTFSALMTLFDI